MILWCRQITFPPLPLPPPPGTTAPIQPSNCDSNNLIVPPLHLKPVNVSTSGIHWLPHPGQQLLVAPWASRGGGWAEQARLLNHPLSFSQRSPISISCTQRRYNIEMKGEASRAWVQILTLPLSSSVTLARLLISDHQFANGAKNTVITYMMWCAAGNKVTICTMELITVPAS